MQQKARRAPGPASGLMTFMVCVWLGLFPLLQGGTYLSITWHKFLFMLALTGLTFIAFLTEVFRKRIVFRPSRTVFAAVFLMLWMILSCLFSGYSPEIWWVGTSSRMEGLRTQLCYFLLFFCFSFSAVSFRPVFWSAVAGLLIFTVIVLLQRAGLNPMNLYPEGYSYALNPEFQGTIGNIDMVTGYLCLLLGLFLRGMDETVSARGRVRLLLPSVAGLGLCLFLLVTMDVQFGIIAGSVGLLFFCLRRLRKKQLRIIVILILLLALILLVFCWPANSGALYELREALQGRLQLSFGSNRLAVWVYSLQMTMDPDPESAAPGIPSCSFWHRLLFGGGSGSFELRFRNYLDRHHLEIPDSQNGVPLPVYFDQPHNEYLALLVNNGVPALILYLLLLFFVPKQNRLLILPYTVQAFFSFSVCLVAPMFWVVLGLSALPDGDRSPIRFADEDGDSCPVR